MSNLMKKLNFKSILHKMYASFTTIILFIIVIIAVSMVSAINANNTSNAIIQERLPEIILMEDINANFNKRLAIAYEFIVTGNDSRATEFRDMTNESLLLEKQLADLSDDEALAEQFQKSEEWSQEALQNVIVPASLGNDLVASGNLNNLRPRTDDILSTYNEMIAGIENQVAGYGESLEQTQTISMIVIVGLGAIAIVLSFIIARNTTKSITDPVREMKTRLEAISNADFSSEPIEVKTQDELGELGRALNVTQDYLIHLIQNIQTASNTLKISSHELLTTGNEVQQGTNQIAATMQELASGSELQANTASNLATEMDSFSGTTKETLQYGEEINTSSIEIVAEAQSGNELMSKSSKQMETINAVVQQAVGQMSQLNEQTDEISNLVDIINRIAKQTNLLALNASIEAARAGEHGRGFAVVADEVRELAEGVADSVAEITTYVQNIQENAGLVTDSLTTVRSDVEMGTSQIQDTDATLAKITSSIQALQKQNQRMADNLNHISKRGSEMNTLIDEIASISQESAAGVEETSASVEQINSSMEEVSEQSEGLVSITDQLEELIRNVKL